MLPPVSSEVLAYTRDGLVNFQRLVNRGVLQRGDYCVSAIDDTLKREEPLCRGHKACAVGSACIAFGMEIDETPIYVDPENHDRGFHISAQVRGYSPQSDWRAEAPDLQLGMEFLNAAALAYCERNGIDVGELYGTEGEHDMLERLFEDNATFPTPGDDEWEVSDELAQAMYEVATDALEAFDVALAPVAA